VLAHNLCIRENADYYVQYNENGKTYQAFHQSAGDYKGFFIAKDNFHHGGSEYKLLKRVAGNKLKLVGDIDSTGKFIFSKHSSNAGKDYILFGKRYI